MGISVIVNICLSISSFLLAFISVVILVVTVRQNHRMIENETRAYLSIYGSTTNCRGVTFYLIIKNFGRSSAFITSLDCDVDLSRFSYVENRTPFSHMINASVAPGQSFMCALQQLPLFNSGIPSITFHITYESNHKHYSESICINLQTFTDLVQTNATPNENELVIIANTLQDINRRLL